MGVNIRVLTKVYYDDFSDYDCVIYFKVWIAQQV